MKQSVWGQSGKETHDERVKAGTSYIQAFLDWRDEWMLKPWPIAMWHIMMTQGIAEEMRWRGQ